jgi:8-oxo-dGTP pyrophosphatase MutT (NUDIX family)
MTAEWTNLLAARPACEEEIVTWMWHDRPLPLKISTHISATFPPDEVITSARAVVLHDRLVAVVRDPHGYHVLPGGRRSQADRSIEQTLRREILEETGLSIDSTVAIGFLRVHHLGAPPADYPYPYPDFAQAIFTARTSGATVSPREHGEFELDVFFRHPDQIADLNLSKRDRALLAEARRIIGH